MSVPPAMSGTGQRKRSYFRDDKKAAEKFAASLRTRYHAGERSGVITKREAEDAAAALGVLEPFGISLLDAATEVVRRLESDGDSELFGARWARVVPLGECHWSARYARDIGKVPLWVPAWFKKTRCGAITPQMIRKAVTEAGAAALSTQEARGARVAAVLNYKPRHRKTTVIEIMTAEQVKAAFAACGDPAERWALGLIIYAGIRPSVDEGEITRLDWEAVGKNEIYVSEEVAKTNTDRHIPITPALRAAIKGHPKSGTVIPAGWKRRMERIRKAAGIAGKSDITRHTFASHYLAAFGEDATKQAMGHAAGSRTLFRHYRKAVTEADGKAFFGAG